MGIRRPSAILLASVTAAALFVAGLFIVAPGTGARQTLPPLSAVAPPRAEAESGALAAPPAEEVMAAAPGAAPRFLDHRIVDPTMLDRRGNGVRRDISDSELRRLAVEYDVIDDDLRGQPDGIALLDTQIAAMHALNPHLLVLRHLSPLHNQDPPFNGIEPGDGEHESWFLRDAAGNDVRLQPDGTWRTEYAPDPANLNVRLEIAAQVRQYNRLGYDGVVLDDVLPYVPGAAMLMTHPLNALTGRPYTDAQWLAATQGMLDEVRRIAGPDVYLAIAGGSASDYAGAEGATLLAGADAVLVRGWASADQWGAGMELAASLGQRGKGLIAIADEGAGGQFAYASFLLAMPVEGGASFGATSLADPPPTAYAPQPPYQQIDLGPPAGGARISGGVWLREFERGFVAVNPDQVAHEVTLPRPFRVADGSVVGHLTVAGRDAVILPSTY